MEEEFDWNKHMKVFTHEVAVKVKKNVTRSDVLLSLLEENEVAFRGKNGQTFLMSLSKLVIDFLEKALKKEQDKSNG